jgi:hypothetical protein
MIPWAWQQKATKSRKNMMAKIIGKNFIFLQNGEFLDFCCE